MEIMRRPETAAAEIGGVVATAPGATAGKEHAAASTRNTSSIPTTVILDKEEKKDDRVVIMKPEARADRSYAAAQTNGKTEDTAHDTPGAVGEADNANNAATKTAWNPLEDVDSALLSALCDPRERKALLKLEQAMLDFMRDKRKGYIEVGGAFNSVVLNQNSGGAYGANGNGEYGPSMSASNQQGLVELALQQQRGLRQTSFQRLILHRLADRFDILREQISNLPDGSPGLIRLVKTPESKIPSNALIDIDLSALIGYKNPRARSSYGAGSGGSFNNSGHDDNARTLSENMAAATLEGLGLGPSSANAGSGKKSKKKMVIMKRNSSSGSGLEGKNKGKQKGKAQRKKLEDREKAYEEARARIFGVSESSGNENGSDDNAERAENADPQDMGNARLESSRSSLTAENEAAAPQDATASESAGEHIVPSQLISSSIHSSTTDLSSPPALAEPPSEDQEPNSPKEDEPPREASQTSFASSNSSVPAAATGSAISKAVYRNRQQEEADPDFKRRSDVRPAYVPAPYVANPMAHPFVPAGAPNPYAPMGQQSMPPQMMSMQMQQQAPPHFYHGQPPQFPTPQDANYANMSHVNQQPPPQWINQGAPPRGYYPPPSHQPGQGQHPNAWQTQRTNSGQMYQHQQQEQQQQGNPMQKQQQQPGKAPSNAVNAPQPGPQPSQAAEVPLNAVNSAQPVPQPSQPTKVAPTTTDGPQPCEPPAKVLWGPGARAADKKPVGPPNAAAAESKTPKTKEGSKAVSYSAEDFPALG